MFSRDFKYLEKWFVIILFFPLSVNALSYPHSEELVDKTNRIIIQYKESDSVNALHQTTTPDERASFMGQSIGVELAFVRQASMGGEILRIQDGRNIDDVVRALNQDPLIEYAEADRRMTILSEPNDPRLNEQWHYTDGISGINLTPVWNGLPLNNQAAPVVAVIDTGIQPHSELAGQMLPGYDFISDEEVANDQDGRDADPTDPGDWIVAGECGPNQPAQDRASSWHGTHVAGTIAAKSDNGQGIAGVAPKAKIVPIRTLGKCGGYLSDIVDAMRWAAGISVPGVPNNPNPAKIINMSLGGTGACGRTYQDAIDDVTARGVVVVVAAGNSNKDVSGYAPASCQNVITVSALNREGGRAFYSNYGHLNDIAAPGGDTRYSSTDGILSLLNEGQREPASESFAFYQGTSMATPHVSGVIALMMMAKSGLTVTEVKELLSISARPFPDVMQNKCSVQSCGAGILDAGNAVAAALGQLPEPSNDTILVKDEPKTRLNATRRAELLFVMQVPEGAKQLSITVSGGTGDVDLFVKHEGVASSRSFDWKSQGFGNDDSVVIENPLPGQYAIALYAYNAFTGVTLLGSYQEDDHSGETGGLVIGKPLTNLSATKGDSLYYPITIPEGTRQLTIKTSGGTGDLDLYVKQGEQPSTRNYDHNSVKFGNNETLVLPNPTAGTLYIQLYAYRAFGEVTLLVTAEGGDAPQDEFVGINDTHMIIPDDNPTGILSPINAPDTNLGTQAEVWVNIEHTYRGDLEISLVAPNGTAFVLQTPSGDDGNNINETYHVNINGTNTQGQWKLKVVDTARKDQGSLIEWRLKFLN